MCGIIGNLNKQNILSELEIKNLIEISKEMNCRGPDNFDYYISPSKKIYFGHLRLSIIDLSQNANQPIISNDGRFVILFNGEIYNFKKLAKKIPNLDKLSSNSDTKVLVEYISSFGVKKAVKDIEGMYAISIYDIQQDKLYLARDFFGKKPIYYYIDNENIFFSSTLKPIIKNNKIKKVFNPESLDHYFNYGFCPNQFSIFKNINKVSQNSLITFDLSKWEIMTEKIHGPQVDEKKNFKLDYKHLDNLIFDSVQKRFISDVPLSILLSSGIDSSLVSYYASKIDNSIETFTVGFSDETYDESKDSRKIAEFYGLKNNTIYFNKSELDQIIYQIPDAFDEPFADSSQIPTMLIFKKISEYSKVCITGDGGDEIFYGYNRYQWFLIWKVFFQKNFLINNKTQQLFIKLTNFLEKKGFGKKFFQKFNISPNKLQKFTNIFFNKNNIYESFLKLSENKNFTNKSNYFFDDNVDNLLDLRNFDINNYLVDDILTKVDRSSMFYSVEARSPLLDKNIYDYIFDVNIKENIDIFSRKKILKKLINDKIPQNLISKKKKGFAFPLNNYLITELRNGVIEGFKEIQNDQRLKFLSISKFEQIINRFFVHSDYKLSYQVWSFYVFFKWFDKYKKYINS